MCVYSMITDHYQHKWEPWRTPDPLDWYPPLPTPPTLPTPEQIKQFEADAAEMKKLLERAKEYDRRTNQADCESEAKKKALREIAAAMGVEIEFP